MSGYTVVLTGNLFDHVLRKTLGLPSLNSHEKFTAFSEAFGCYVHTALWFLFTFESLKAPLL